MNIGFIPQILLNYLSAIFLPQKNNLIYALLNNTVQ